MGGIDAETMLIVGIFLAVGAGALSFFSPCVLPIFPAFLSYITGVSVKQLQGEQDWQIRKKLWRHSLLFLAGVSLVYISLGIGASVLGHWIQGVLIGDSGLFIQRFAGGFMIFMGLIVGGWLNINAFMKERRFHHSRKPVGYLGTLLVGLGFAAGWTPCIGPVFGSILFLAASNPGYGVLYTLMYVIGFSIPFIVLAFFIGSTRWIVRYSQAFMKTGAVIMIVMGVVLFTGQMPRITEFLLKLVEGTWFTRLG